MKLAVVGSGISGLAAAWLLSRQHEVTVFEADSRVGGHTHSHEIETDRGRLRIDSGFIVCNRDHYPLFFRLLDHLGVATQETTMSFAVRNERSGLEYNATNLNRLFVQRRNLLSPRFWSMIRDILRFYREAPRLLAEPSAGPTLGDYLLAERFGAAFRDDHLVPMASALWSSPSRRILDFPVKYLVSFMANHQMLEAGNRKPWRVLVGGSTRYVEAMLAGARFVLRASTPVRAIRRDQQGVLVSIDGSTERFDQIVLACHSDQALSLLADASAAEQDILGAIRYQQNETLLHTDTRVLPRRRRAWAAWNALIPAQEGDACTVSYDMNQLQRLDADQTYCVSLNCGDRIDPTRVLARMHYAHPLYTQQTVVAQARRHEINGQNHTWFAGAYWGHGFHEDGMRSAVDVATGLGVRWP